MVVFSGTVGEKVVITQQEFKIVSQKLDSLKPHPHNERIYGQNEDVSDLIKLMQAKGFIQKYAITINSDNVIVCGHRRWLAAQKVGMTECAFPHFKDNKFN